MGMSGQMGEEVQGKEEAGRNEEGVGGIDGASWSAGACTRRGAKQASFCLFDDFMYFVTNTLYYLGLISKITNVFGIDIPKLLMFLGLISQNY